MFAAHIVAQLIQIAKLALAGRMVHQADDPDAILRAKLSQFGDQGFRTYLGAQVQKMVDPQGARFADGQNLIRQKPRIFAVTGLVFGHNRPDPQRIKHCGDARRG